MKHNELLNSLRKGDEAVMARFGAHPELLNTLLAIAQNPIPWKHGLAAELKNANGAVNQASLGFQYATQTTTLIAAEVIMQRFYEEAIADFASVLVGRGPWMDAIKTNLTFDAAGPFEDGDMDLGTRSVIPNVEVGLSPITAALKGWNKGYSYSIMEVERALASNNWDIVEAKFKALTKNWQLGIQQVGFLGKQSNLTLYPGLLSNSACTVNNSFINKPLSTMSAAEMDAVVAGLIGLFRTNSNETVFPKRLTVPMSDWTGLGVNVSIAGVPISQTKLEYLTKAFQGICGKDFQILPTAYGNKVRNAGFWAAGGTNRYALYNNDRETLHMDIPIDLTIAAPATANNVHFTGVGYGQYSGMIVYRVPEVMYFDDASSL
ncbi:MAG: major capsid family protein [bacterium]